MKTLTTQQAKNQVLKIEFMGWKPLKKEVIFVNELKNDFEIVKNFEVSMRSSCVASKVCVWSVAITIDKYDGSFTSFVYKNK